MLLGQETQANGGLHFKAEIAKPAEAQGIGLSIEHVDVHGFRATPEPPLMPIEIGTHLTRGGAHLHLIREMAAVAADLRVFAVAQGIGWMSRQEQHGWRSLSGVNPRMSTNVKGAGGQDSLRSISR